MRLNIFRMPADKAFVYISTLKNLLEIREATLFAWSSRYCCELFFVESVTKTMQSPPRRVVHISNPESESIMIFF